MAVKDMNINRDVAIQHRRRLFWTFCVLALALAQNAHAQGFRRAGYFLPTRAGTQQPSSWRQGPVRPGGGPGGENSNVVSTGCERSTGSCRNDGSSNYADLSQLSYDPQSGRFTGIMKYNGCANHPTSNAHTTQAGCYQKELPDPSFSGADTDTPSAAPLLGAVGMSRYGVFIYGPFEAGFGTAPNSNGMSGMGRPVPNPCGPEGTNNIMGGSYGYCAGGIDVKTCEDGLLAACGAQNTITELFMDSCGGHANPYHYHSDLSCSYGDWMESDNDDGHAPLLGFANDGFGLYGLYETNQTIPPSDLDACNGHFGIVPLDGEIAQMESDMTTSMAVYHYHTTDYAPFTIGCYGPEVPPGVQADKADSKTMCRDLYEGCSDGTDVPLGTIVNNGRQVFDDETPYKLWCPCFSQN